MATKILNLIALSSLAILACSFGAAPVNALSVDVSNHAARQLGHHQLIAKKKRADTRRCKPRPTTIAAPVNTSIAKVATTPATTVKPETTPAKASETPKPAPTTAASTKKTSSSVKPAPTPAPAPPSTGSAGGGKVGLGYSDDSVTLKNFVTKKTQFIYTWSPFKPPNSDQLGLKFAPMFWGMKQANDFQRLVVPGYASIALGQNEPDQSGQANIDPGTGASEWRTYLEPLKNKGYKLVSPAVSSAPAGKTWMKNFFNECSGCTVDAVAVHWYGTDVNAFIAYLQDFHSTFGKPLWVTEVACQSFSGGPQCSASQVTDFMNTATAFMDSSDFVEAYFFFGLSHIMDGVNSLNQLVGSNNEPTALGANYLN